LRSTSLPLTGSRTTMRWVRPRVREGPAEERLTLWGGGGGFLPVMRPFLRLPGQQAVVAGTLFRCGLKRRLARVWQVVPEVTSGRRSPISRAFPPLAWRKGALMRCVEDAHEGWKFALFRDAERWPSCA
jgi:hypothetical protein